MSNIRFEPPDSLASFEYQEFLVSQQAMTRVENYQSCQWTLRPSTYQSELRDQLWEVLVASPPGFIMSRRKITRALGNVSGPTEADIVYKRGISVRDSMDDPGSLFVRYCGQGLGVKNLVQTDEEILATLFVLWQDTNKFVSARVLAQRLIGDSSKAGVEAAITRFNEIGEKIPLKSARVEAADFDLRRYYRLKLLDEDQTNKKKASGAERYPLVNEYREEYQHWLGSVGIIKYAEEFPRLELKEGQEFSNKQQQAVDLITDNRGYLVPREAIFGVYQSKPYPPNWAKRLSSNLDKIKKRVTNPQHIFTLSEGGWALGIENITIPASALLPLYRLWVNKDDFVQLGRNSGYPLLNDDAAQKVREALEQSPFIMGSLHGKPGLHILTERTNLVKEPQRAA